MVKRLGVAQLLFDALALDELTDLTADDCEHLHEIGVWPENGTAKELDHANRLGGKQDGESKGSPHPFANRVGSPRAVRVLGNIDEPHRFPRGPDAAGHADARG